MIYKYCGRCKKIYKKSEYLCGPCQRRLADAQKNKETILAMGINTYKEMCVDDMQLAGFSLKRINTNLYKLCKFVFKASY